MSTIQGASNPIDTSRSILPSHAKSASIQSTPAGTDDPVFLGESVSIGEDTDFSTPPTAIKSVDFPDDSEVRSSRTGFDPHFISKDMPVNLPVVRPSHAHLVLDMGKGKTVRDYTHFSIVMNKDRKLCFYTACNIDGNSIQTGIDRAKWQTDMEIGPQNQLGHELYTGSVFDRGHMVRRQAVTWGPKNEARRASDDTFNYPNAAPQHKQLNQKTWLKLEDWILQKADSQDRRVSEFTGPVFRDNDPVFRGERIPTDFWKVVIVKKPGEEKPTATAFMMTQKHLMKKEAKRDGDRFRDYSGYGADANAVETEEIAPYQVTIKSLEDLTGLDFGDLKEVDAYALYQERKAAAMSFGELTTDYTFNRDGLLISADLSPEGPRPIRSQEDIIL